MAKATGGGGVGAGGVGVLDAAFAAEVVDKLAKKCEAVARGGIGSAMDIFMTRQTADTTPVHLDERARRRSDWTIDARRRVSFELALGPLGFDASRRRRVVDSRSSAVSPSTRQQLYVPGPGSSARRSAKPHLPLFVNDGLGSSRARLLGCLPRLDRSVAFGHTGPGPKRPYASFSCARLR